MHRVIHDCTFALHFQPDNFKALYRRSIAFIFISEYGFAISGTPFPVSETEVQTNVSTN